MNDGCGAKPSELLRTSSQLSLWQRIPSAFSTMMEAARSEDSCGRLPRSGTYANGTLSPLPTLVLRTSGNASGLLPTPTVFHALRGNHDEPVEVYQQRVQDHKDGKTKGKPGPSLGIAVRMWPTPTANPPAWKNIEVVDKKGMKPTHANQRFYDKKTGRLVQRGLAQTVAMSQSEYGGDSQTQHHTSSIGLLNPSWVDWLMGYPAGWTDLGASETP